jgi:hypothetical protein
VCQDRTALLTDFWDWRGGGTRPTTQCIFAPSLLAENSGVALSLSADPVHLCAFALARALLALGGKVWRGICLSDPPTSASLCLRSWRGSLGRRLPIRPSASLCLRSWRGSLGRLLPIRPSASLCLRSWRESLGRILPIRPSASLCLRSWRESLGRLLPSDPVHLCAFALGGKVWSWRILLPFTQCILNFVIIALCAVVGLLSHLRVLAPLASLVRRRRLYRFLNSLRDLLRRGCVSFRGAGSTYLRQSIPRCCSRPVDTGPPTTDTSPTENRNYLRRCQSPNIPHPHPKFRWHKFGIYD